MRMFFRAAARSPGWAAPAVGGWSSVPGRCGAWSSGCSAIGCGASVDTGLIHPEGHHYANDGDSSKAAEP